MQPTLFNDADLPLEARTNAQPGPVERMSPPSRLPLLEPAVGQETDCVDALSGGRWADAEALLERLRDRVREEEQADIDAAARFVRDLAERPAIALVARLGHVAHAARFTPTNAWIRHACTFLLNEAVSEAGTARAAALLDERAFPFAYELLVAGSKEPRSTCPARALLRDALVVGRPVDISSLNDPELLALDSSDDSPAWYPVIGAILGLWTHPRTSARELTDAMVDTSLPNDDAGRAMMFWQCYRLWKSQREPNATIARTRSLMKRLHPQLFEKLR